MQPPVRGQRSIVRQADFQTPLDASYRRGDPERGTMARQEDRDEADINTITRRFGLSGQLPPQRPVHYGVALDDDVDLQTSYIMREDAQRAFFELPAETRKKYGNWMRMLDAIHTGELKVYELTGDGKPPTTEQPPTTEKPPAPELTT